MALGRPREFPDAYWLPVIAAEATARARLLTTLAGIPWRHSGNGKFLSWDDVKKSVGEYLIAVVQEFAAQAVSAVRAKQLPITKLESTIEEFIELALKYVYFGLDHEKIRATWSDPRYTSVGRDMLPVLKAAPWYAQYLAEIPELMNAVAEPKPEGASPGKAERRGMVIKPLLKSRGLSVAQWADRAGVNQNVAYDYMNGKSDPRPENRKALAQALDLDAEDIPN